MKKVSIVIVNYNGLIHNEECIKSILGSSYKNIEIVIVDNKSTDKSIEKLRDIFKEKITIIVNEENSGFAGGTNVGIKYALNNGADYVLLLNNDTIIDSKMIEIMVKASNINNSVISPKIYYFDNKDMIWSAGGEIKWNRGYTIQYGMNEIDKGQFNERKDIDFATGCCMLIPKNIVNEIGLMPEEYFLYFEDTDYCVKIKKAGYQIIYEPEAFMYHKVSATTGGEDNKNYVYYFSRNRLEFNKKYNRNKIYYFYILLSWMKKIIVWAIRGRYELISSLVQGIKDQRNNVYGIRLRQ